MYDDVLHLDQEPLVNVSEAVQLVHIVPLGQGLCDDEDPLVGGVPQLLSDRGGVSDKTGDLNE